MTQSVLISGATGFIGSHLARRFVQEKRWNVGIITRPSSDLSCIEDIRDQVSVHPYDGTVSSLRCAIESRAPDLAFHLASRFISRHKAEDIPELFESNILFGSHLAEAMASSECKQLVNTGTSWEHYQNQNYSPVNLYAATKQAFEAVLQYYVEAQQLRVVTLKLFDTYGPGDPRQKLFSVFRRAEEAQQPVAMTAGEQLIDLVYLDDVLDAFCAAAECVAEMPFKQHLRYAVSSGMPLSLRDLASKYEQVLGCKLNIDWGRRDYLPREVMQPWNAGIPVSGWSAKIGLHEGIRRTCRTRQALPTAS